MQETSLYKAIGACKAGKAIALPLLIRKIRPRSLQFTMTLFYLYQLQCMWQDNQLLRPSCSIALLIPSISANMVSGRGHKHVFVVT